MHLVCINPVLFGCFRLVTQSHSPLCSFVLRRKHLKNNQVLYYTLILETYLCFFLLMPAKNEIATAFRRSERAASAPCLPRSHLRFWQTVNSNIMGLSITKSYQDRKFCMFSGQKCFLFMAVAVDNRHRKVSQVYIKRKYGEAVMASPYYIWRMDYSLFVFLQVSVETYFTR